MKRHRIELEGEQGAILVHTAFVILALIAFTTFVFDYGVFYVSRRQAQTAADAGALAGAIQLILDPSTSPTGPAGQAAVAVAQSNPVWGAAPIVNPGLGDVLILSGTGVCPPPNVDGTCIRVDAYRSSERGNPLPMFFGSLVGLTQQNVKATATAQVMIADATDCLKPWAVVDRWAEHWPINPGIWSSTSTFDKYQTNGSGKGTIDPSIATPDVYVAPTTTDAGTGFHPYDSYGNYTPDYGMEMTLKQGDGNDFDFVTGWFAALALNNSSGASDMKANIKGCVGTTYKIGDELSFDTEPGDMVGPTKQAVAPVTDGGDDDSLIAKDPDAYWDPTVNPPYGGIAGSAFPSSPRIVAIPLVNPDMLAAANAGGRTTVPIANIMGFFVERYDGPCKCVVGRLVTIPGLKVSGSAPIGGESAFLHTVVLVR